MAALGRHLLGDLYGCDAKRLDDAEFIGQAMRRAAQAAGATVLNADFHRFSPCGVTGVLTLKESHLAIHTWPEHGFAAIDLFTCGKDLDPERAYAVLVEALDAGKDRKTVLWRGQDPAAEG